MTNTVYVFIKTDEYSVQLLEKILILAVGGYKVKCHCIQLVIIDLITDANSVNQSNMAKMSEKIRQYNNLRAHLKDYETDLCNTNVASLVCLKYNSHPINQYSLLQDNTAMQRSVGLLISIRDNFNISFNQDDKIIIALSANEHFEELNIARSILSKYSKDGQNKNITTIYDLTQVGKQIPANLKRAISTLGEKCNLIIVGLSESNKPSFTQLQTASAVFDSINYNIYGEPIINGTRNDLCYGSDNLSSSSASIALGKLALLEKLQMSGIENVASSWKNNLKVKDPWNEIPMLCYITPFLACLHQWMDGFSNTDFSLEIKPNIFNGLVKELNSVAVLPKISSQGNRRKEATLSILAAIERNINSIPKHEMYKSISDISNKNEWEFRIWDTDIELSPTTAYEIMNLSFSEKYLSNKDASVWRSVCLDLWELFFINETETIASFFEIGECSVSKNLNSIEKELLSFSELGRIIIDTDLYYYISGKKLRFLAYTSPLTGFCFTEHEGCSIVINSCRYLSLEMNDVRDLKDRSEYFQQFMYSYVNMRDNLFSDYFRSYIDNQIEKNKAFIQSKGTDVIKLYPQYRKHIPLDIGIQQDV